MLRPTRGLRRFHYNLISFISVESSYLRKRATIPTPTPTSIPLYLSKRTSFTFMIFICLYIRTIYEKRPHATHKVHFLTTQYLFIKKNSYTDDLDILSWELINNYLSKKSHRKYVMQTNPLYLSPFRKKKIPNIWQKKHFYV